ncbi:MAG: hypothetical protein GQ570_00740 [Helicobacteraceae bacterium]|nr:hypothetical protein [Helicobacteraceae bacterium]
MIKIISLFIFTLIVSGCSSKEFNQELYDRQINNSKDAHSELNRQQ